MLLLLTLPPTFSLLGGYIEGDSMVEVAPADPADTVLVGLGPTDPTAPYAGPIPISGTTIVRAQALGPDGSPSPIVTRTFLSMDGVLAPLDAAILSDPAYGPIVEDTLLDMPAISLVLGAPMSTAEQRVSLEWLDPAGAPGPRSFQMDCGAALSGTTSLGYPKNSVRLYFREAYGEGRLEADIFPLDQPGLPPAGEYDALSLRSGHDSVFWLGAQGQYTRNFWMDETLLAMGRVSPHGTYAHLYLNGAYHGLYHVRERWGAAMTALYMGGREDEHEAINGGTVYDGDGAAWARTLANLAQWPALADSIDRDAFLDYMLLEFYAANQWDWSAWHNWAAAGPSAPGAGGLQWSASDADIALHYPEDTDLTWAGGPADMFANLVNAGDEGFFVALADAIHRNLEEGGPLTPEAAGARYARISTLIEGAVVAESARWGGGWWDRDEEWESERQRLLGTFFPQRTAYLLEQLRARGWLFLPAPHIDGADGVVPEGTVVTSWSDEPGAELWVTTDGADPRDGGGGVHVGAAGPEPTWSGAISWSSTVRARLRKDGRWGPIEERTFVVLTDTPVVLNEWNTVAADRFLDDTEPGDGADDAWGRVLGNGGPWIELLTVAAVDLRGWTLTMEDRFGARGQITLTDDPLLSDLAAGTLLTIATELPEDASYAPDLGDWRLHLRSTEEGRYARGPPWTITTADWRLTVRDALGRQRFGPVGESIEPASGLGGDEVGALRRTPDATLSPGAADYDAAERSSFGAENRWDGGAQDLRPLRGLTGEVVQEPELPTPAEGAGDEPGVDPDDSSGAGCSLGGAGLSGAPSALALLFVVLSTFGGGCTPVGTRTDEPVDNDDGGPTPPWTCFLDRDGDGAGDAARAWPCEAEGAATTDGDCDDFDSQRRPGAPEVCDGADDDCDGAIDEDAVDGLPFWPDQDDDGWGGADIVTGCTAPPDTALVGGDCDDGDAQRHPQALEDCDDTDDDCDGVVADGFGAAEGCPAASCLDIAMADPTAPPGPAWITLPSGLTTQLYCDGGWTLAFIRNTASWGNQGGFGGADFAIESLTTSPTEAAASTVPAMAWLDMNAFSFTELQVAAYSGSVERYRSRIIPRSALRIAFGDDGYLLWGEEGYWWCGGNASYTDAGLGAVDNPPGASLDCKGHGSLGSGWDFSESDGANAGLTLCGADGSSFLSTEWGGGWLAYGTPGGAQAIWVR